MNDHYTVACPTCAASPKAACRTLTRGEPTAVHMSRLRAQYPRCGRCGLELQDGRCWLVGCGA